MKSESSFWGLCVKTICVNLFDYWQTSIWSLIPNMSLNGSRMGMKVGMWAGRLTNLSSMVTWIISEAIECWFLFVMFCYGLRKIRGTNLTITKVSFNIQGILTE